jgi:hypothetical protein
VRVADPAENARIGQRALQRPVLAPECLYEGVARRLQHLQPARVDGGEAILATDHVQ